MPDRRFLLPLVCAAALLAAVPARAAHPFYERLLTEGTLAYERGELESAARDLRLAAFGLLEEPPVLAEALTRLALAQAGLGDEPGFQQTFARILEIEDRFGAYRDSGLPPELRATFEERVRELVPAPSLALSPTFRGLLEREPAGGEPAPAEPRGGKRRRQGPGPGPGK